MEQQERDQQRQGAEQPDRVVPRSVTGARAERGVLAAELPPRSWNVLRLEGAG